MTIPRSLSLRCGGAIFLALLAVSCAGTKDEAGKSPAKKVARKATGLDGDYDYMIDKYAVDPDTMRKTGTGEGKRSQFEGRKNIAFGGGVGNASYQKHEYKAPAWNGRQEAQTATYSGPTDGSRFQEASRFQGAGARQTAQRSRFDSKAARTGSYAPGGASAPESSSRRLDKPTDGWTDFRRRVYPEPLIMSKADYERLTVEETRRMLGRD